MQTFVAAWLGLVISSSFLPALTAAPPLPPPGHKQTGQAMEAPKSGFPTLEELRQWAESSSFGGGSLTTFDLDGQQVHVANRSFTSGVPTSEISVYVDRPKPGGYQRVLFLPVRRTQMRAALLDGALVFKQYDNISSEWVTALTLAPDFFRP